MMLIKIVLVASIAFQVGAAFIALWMIRLTRRHWAWIMVTAALGLMIARRAITLTSLSPGKLVTPAMLNAEWVALGTSIALFAGIIGIKAIFKQVERARAEARRGQARYQALFDNMTNGVVQFALTRDENGAPLDAVVSDVNPAFEKLMDMPKDAAVGRRFLEVFDNASQKDLRACLAVALNAGSFEEDREDLRSGRTFHEFVFAPSPGQFAIVIQDVTDRRRKQDEILKFKRICDSANYGLVIMDMDGFCHYANDGLSRLLGYPVEEVVGRHYSCFIDASQKEVYRKSIEAMLAGDDVSSVEGVGLRRDGSKFPVLRNMTLIRDEQGTPAFFAISVIDVGEMKALEEQLRQSQRMEAVGLLASGVAHDFNNLLMVIYGYAEMAIAALPKGHAVVEMIEEMRRAGERGSRIVQQLLAYGRRQKLTVEVTSLNHVVAETATMLRRLAGENVQIVTRLDPALGATRADVTQLQQILMNLVVNARDAIEDSGQVMIETSNVDLDEEQARRLDGMKPGPCVRMTISDTGSGMSRETISKIFDPFFTTKPRGQGTGLGLATVHGIVKQLDGDVAVQSIPGHGTTFHIYLPRVSGDAPVGEEVRLNDGQAASGAGNGETILLVEDSPSVRDLTAKIFSSNGYRVLMAQDVDHAVRLFETTPDVIDLLVTDVIMPTMNGSQLCHRLRQTRPNLKALFMSGYARDVLDDAGEDYPFIQKPFTPQALLVKAREVLASRKLAPDAPPRS